MNSIFTKMNSNKNIILFVNDSYFSYLLSKDLIEAYHESIDLIVFSESTTNSKNRIIDIYKKVSIRYFIYRVFIHILSKTVFRKKSIKRLASIFNINSCCITTANQLKEKFSENIYDIGFAFNFDLIIRKNLLSKFQKGIYNIHASKLPKDKGISPVLWAFARGDENIWSTIYRMDEGIDSGPVARQFKIFVKANDTSFSIYKRVCIKSGYLLNSMVDQIINNEIVLLEQLSESDSNYFSWPDHKFHIMMKKSNRKFISIKDFF